jgi:hypothetical protein
LTPGAPCNILEHHPISIRSFLALTACATCLYDQAPAEKARNILTSASHDKSGEWRAKAVPALGLIPGDVHIEAAAVAALSVEREEVRSTAAVVFAAANAL